MGLAARIERRFDDRPGRLTLATAGCARNCSEAQTTDIGAVAMGDGSWEIYVGGAEGAARRKGHVQCIKGSQPRPDKLLRFRLAQVRVERRHRAA